MTKLPDAVLKGMDAASQTLRQLTGGRITIEEVRLETVRIDLAVERFASRADCVSAIGMNICESPQVHLLMMFDEKSSRTAAGIVVGGEESLDDEMERSVLQEIANMVGSGLSNTLSEVLGKSVRTSIPEVVEDMPAAVVSSTIAIMPDACDDICLLDVAMVADNRVLNSSICLFMDHTLQDQMTPSRSEVGKENLEGVGNESCSDCR